MAKLHFDYSAMNAGKSTTLLQSAYNYEERRMETILFTPAIDTSYCTGKISSRIGLQSNAVSFDSNFDLFDYVSHALQQPGQKIKCVLNGEAQFFKTHNSGYA